jgi:hypothetical protein
LGWNLNYAAGKNAIINGDFRIWQRGTSFAAGVYCADRFINDSDGTCTATQQTFTPGTAPVAGYEGLYYLQQARTATGTYQIVAQRVEDVRTFAGQTVTLSFWAKADSTVTNVPNISQNFGTGGSAQVTTTAGSVTLTTSWARYTYTVTLGSVSGKTIGSGSNIEVRPIRIVDGAAHTIQVWGVQLEAGSVSTAFQTATGTLQGELAACQRYLPAFTTGIGDFVSMASGTSSMFVTGKLPITARVAPTGISASATMSNYNVFNGSLAGGTPVSFVFANATQDVFSLTVTTTAGSPTLATGQASLFRINANGYILFTGCEL